MNTLAEISDYTTIPTNPAKAFVYSASVQTSGSRQPKNIYAVFVDPTEGRVKNIRSRAIIKYKTFYVSDARRKRLLKIMTERAEIVALSWQNNLSGEPT